MVGPIMQFHYIFRQFLKLFPCILPNLPISRALHITIIIIIIIGEMYKLTNCFEQSQ
jgi:hypothetical protein